MKTIFLLSKNAALFILSAFIFSIAFNDAATGVGCAAGGTLLVSALGAFKTSTAFASIVPNFADVAQSLTGAYGYYSEEDLQMIGAVAKSQGLVLSKIQAVEMAKATNAIQSKRAVEQTLPDDAKFLIAKRASLPVDIQTSILKGSGKLINASYYSRKRLGLGGNNQMQPLIEQKDDLYTGRTNIPNGKLENGVAMSIAYVMLNYGFNADSVDAPESQDYTNARLVETDGTPAFTIPAGILNGELEILIDSKTWGMKVPIKDFFRDGISVQSSLSRNTFAYRLPSPLIWTGNQIIQANITLADALPAGDGSVNRHFMEVVLMGAAIKI